MNQPRGTVCRINLRSINMQIEDGQIIKDFLEQNWAAWLAYCEENNISETDAGNICDQLGE